MKTLNVKMTYFHSKYSTFFNIGNWETTKKHNICHFLSNFIIVYYCYFIYNINNYFICSTIK